MALFVFAGEIRESAAPGYWVVALVLTGLLTVALSAATVLDRESLRPLAQRADILLPASLQRKRRSGTLDRRFSFGVA